MFLSTLAATKREEISPKTAYCCTIVRSYNRMVIRSHASRNSNGQSFEQKRSQIGFSKHTFINDFCRSEFTAYSAAISAYCHASTLSPRSSG